MPNANSLRLLLASPGAPSADRAQTLHALGAALTAVNVASIVLQGWGGAGRLHVDRSDAQGYPVYRSDAPHADIGLLALMERPSVAVLFGVEALPLAGSLVAAGLPVMVLLSGDYPVDLGGLENNRYLALAATTPPEAERLALLQGSPVAVLPIPQQEKTVFEAGGEAILVLANGRHDGVALALALAEARPTYRFLFPAMGGRAPWVLERLARLSNVRELSAGETLPPVRLALLPNCFGAPPWETLAGVMHAGVPFLVGDAPLLAAGIGAAGLAVPLTAPADVWFSALDGLMSTSDIRVRAEAACPDQAAHLRPPAPQAASRWRDRLQAHIARCHGLAARRV